MAINSLTFLEVLGGALRAVDLASHFQETVQRVSLERVTVAGQRRVRTGFAAFAGKRSSIPKRMTPILKQRS
jgi:hypothetical protein